VGKLKLQGAQNHRQWTRDAQEINTIIRSAIPELAGRILPGVNSLTLTRHVAVNIDISFILFPQQRDMQHILPVADTL
jgi:hypothetical protein